MKKIIVKCKLKSRADFEKRLTDIEIKFGPIYWQHDRVYVPRGFKRATNMPRLIMRTEMKSVDKPAKYELILRRHIEDSGIDIVNSTVVKDYIEMVNIVHQLGFEKRAEVSRRRQDIEMGDGVMFAVDKVDDLPGSYARLEVALEKDDKVNEVREDLERTFLVLGQDAGTILEQSDFELVEKAALSDSK